MKPTFRLIQPYTPTPDDIHREARMQECLDGVQRAGSAAMKRQNLDEYTRLHHQRGPDFVRYLELAKGLYRGQ